MPRVPVIDPSGVSGDVEQTDLPAYLDQGYTQDSPEAQASRQKETKFGTPLEMAKTAVEGLGEGIAGPISPAIERLGGERPEDIRSRAETNPWTHGISKAVGLGAGLMTGTGLPGLAVGAGKAVGGTLARGAAEMAVLALGDEATKAVLQDPNQTATNAIANVGLSSVLGGAMGVAGKAASSLFGKVGDVLADSKMGKWVGDVKDRLGYHIDNPNPGTSLSDHMTQYYEDMKGLTDSVRGGEGLKAQDIAATLPESITPNIRNVMGDTIQHISGAVDKIAAEPAIYQGGAGKALEAYRDRLITGISEDSSPKELFTALDQFKKDIAPLKKWNSLSPETEKPASKLIGDVYGKVQMALEDQGAWGEAGKIQSEVNQAWSKYIPALKDAEKSFTIPTAEGTRIIDPGKLQTYINQTDKLSGEIKRGRMQDFLEASENFKSTLKDTYSRLGLEAPTTISPQALLDTVQSLSSGAKFADTLVKRGLAKMGGQAIGGSVGAAAGSVVGMPAVGAALGSMGLGPVFESLLPTIVKPLLSKEANAPAVQAALDYAQAAVRTEGVLKRAVKAITSGTVLDISDRLIKSAPEELERLDKMVAEVSLAPDKLLNMGHNLAHYMPDHSSALTAHSSNIIQYLVSQKPHPASQLPFDREFKANDVHAGQWNRTLQLADKPLSILKTIQSGRSTMRDMQDMTAMYPQMLSNIKDKLMQGVLDAKSSGKSIPYATRMHMSLFVGEPLDSTMVPSSIQALQAVFAVAGTPASPQKGSKGSTKALAKGPAMYATPSQARDQARQNKA